jgi:hypothetical protein
MIKTREKEFLNNPIFKNTKINIKDRMELSKIFAETHIPDKSDLFFGIDIGFQKMFDLVESGYPNESYFDEDDTNRIQLEKNIKNDSINNYILQNLSPAIKYCKNNFNDEQVLEFKIIIEKTFFPTAFHLNKYKKSCFKNGVYAVGFLLYSSL